MSNKAFTQRSSIGLDDKHYLISDDSNGVILVFNEPRQRDKMEVKNGKKVKTGEQEDYLFEEKFYYPRVCQALKHYVDKTQNQCTTLEKLIYRVDYNTQLLERLDKEFMQFN
jgi:hypothetical protein